MRSVTYSMGVSLDGYIVGPGWHLRLDGTRSRGLSVLDRRHSRRRRASAGAAAVRDDAVLGDRRTGPVAQRRRTGMDGALEAAAQGGLLDHGGGHSASRSEADSPSRRPGHAGSGASWSLRTAAPAADQAADGAIDGSPSRPSGVPATAPSASTCGFRHRTSGVGIGASAIASASTSRRA
jgi:hypothetical protein